MTYGYMQFEIKHVMTPESMVEH